MTGIGIGFSDPRQEPVALLAIVCQTKFKSWSKACSLSPKPRGENLLASRVAREASCIVVHGVPIKITSLRTRMQSAGRTIMAARTKKAATKHCIFFLATQNGFFRF